MDELDALLAAVVANPDDDLPRLVYADYLEDRDELDRAAFIRDQVEYARCEAWEPFAVRLRNRRAEQLTGAAWRSDLPSVGDPAAVEWHPQSAFRRGFPWGLVVRFVPTLITLIERELRSLPVGHLTLHTATLDNWRALAAEPWLSRIRGLHFAGLRTPIESARELTASQFATGLRELSFSRADGAGMPALLDGVLRSSVGPQLESLEFRTGPNDPEELIGVLLANLPPRLERLSLTNLHLRPELLERLVAHPRMAELRHLDLRGNPFGYHSGMHLRQFAPVARRLESLSLRGCDIGWEEGRPLLGIVPPGVLRSLDLSDNSSLGYTLRELDRHDWFTGLRSLRMARSGLTNDALERLVDGPHWSGLAELDLQRNQLGESSYKTLLRVEPPPELAALDLRGNRIRPDVVTKLREVYGDALLTDPS